MTKSNYSFMVVEDDLHAAQSIVNRMKKFENWKLTAVESGLSIALIKIEKHKPDLLFLDWEIVGGNTFTILDKIETLENYRPYIIFFTGYQSDNPEIPTTIINKYQINKYLIKPIFENLTNNLKCYINEAETYTSNKSASCEFWITTIEKQKIRINPDKIICILQSKAHSKNKVIYTAKAQEYEVRATWTDCEMIAKKFGIKLFKTNSRDTMINQNHIIKLQKPFIWLTDNLKIEVTKDKWKQVEDNCKTNYSAINN